MINPKNIGISAAIGFVLSFLIGIFSGVSFLLVLLRALICAVIFAAVGAGASILFQKFLSVEQSDTVSDAPVEKAQRVGGIVDYIVGDDTLPDEEQGPRFDVSMTRSSLKAGVKPIGESAPVRQTPMPPPVKSVSQGAVAAMPNAASASNTSASPKATAGFTPVNLADATKSSPVQPVASSEEADDSGMLDELPDIGGISLGGDKDDAEDAGNGDVVSDSEFAMEDGLSSVRMSDSSKSKPATEQNASVMAQAIRTILAKN